MQRMAASELITALRKSVRGPLLGPDDARFDEGRESFNGLIDRRPAAIVRPVDATDAAAAIRVAREHALPVSVRGGGHSVAGHAVGEGGVMIDLRLLRDVLVDPSTRTVRVGGGACWNDVDARTQSYGMAMPGGTYGDTGVAGLALTGGIGHLIGLFGLTIDNLLSAEVVTADGRIVRADEDGEPDLFWALRGGGGNFGVVTEFVFRIHEVDLMTAGLLVHRLEDAPLVLRAWRDSRDQMPDALTTMPALAPTAILGGHDRVLLTSVVFASRASEAEAAIEPLLVASPVLDTVGPAFYSQAQGLYPYMPFGLRNYWTGRFVQDIPDELIEFLVEHVAISAEGSEDGVLFEPMHGAAARVEPEATAFGFRRARFNVSPMAVWDDPSMDEGQITWAGAARDLLQPLSPGGYLNYSTDDGASTVEGAFGTEGFARLRAVKAVWDPDNVFRFNHNIPPAA